MTRFWPFLPYAALVIVHAVLLLTRTDQDYVVVKALLMPALLLAVLTLALWTDRVVVSTPRSRWAFVLLSTAIGFSWLGDVGIWVSLEFGIAGFAVAHLAYIGLFLGPGRARTLPWWAIPYGLVYLPFIGVVWAHLGAFGSLIAVYGLLLLAMAVTSLGVDRVAALGGLVFAVSESLLALRMFVPEWLGWFPDPLQDTTIMALYCLGQGLIAAGVIRRLEAEPALAAVRAERRSAAGGTALAS